MKFSQLLILVILFTSCNHAVKSGNRLELNQDIERLTQASEKAVKNWNGYKDLENNLKLICNTNALNAVTFKNSLKANIARMEKNIPQAVNNRAINKHIAFVNRKVDLFCNDIKDDELDKNTVQKHLNDIMNAFEALNISINNTIADL